MELFAWFYGFHLFCFTKFGTQKRSEWACYFGCYNWPLSSVKCSPLCIIKIYFWTVYFFSVFVICWHYVCRLNASPQRLKLSSAHQIKDGGDESWQSWVHATRLQVKNLSCRPMLPMWRTLSLTCEKSGSAIFRISDQISNSYEAISLINTHLFLFKSMPMPMLKMSSGWKNRPNHKFSTQRLQSSLDFSHRNCGHLKINHQKKMQQREKEWISCHRISKPIKNHLEETFRYDNDLCHYLGFVGGNRFRVHFFFSGFFPADFIKAINGLDSYHSNSWVIKFFKLKKRGTQKHRIGCLPMA